MSEENNYIGNLSSLVKTISMLIAGAVIGVLVNFGLNLSIDTATLSGVIGSIIWLGISYIDMRYPNTIFPQKTETPTEPEVEDLDVGEEDGC